MKPKIGIVDYGMGNIRSVEKGFEKTGFPAELVSSAERLAEMDALVLPGVGAFGDAMENLGGMGMTGALKDHVRGGKPFLGICLGMQLLLEESLEHGRHAGLGVVPGVVERLSEGLKVPHMGWNVVETDAGLFRDVPRGSRFYFVHSYHCRVLDESWIAGTTPYGKEFVSVVGRGRVWGVQFHPEKSSYLGLQVLKAFGGIAGEKTP